MLSRRLELGPDEDRRLCRRILDGDRAAGEELVARHVDALYEFVHYRVASDRASAEDIVQDTFLVALSSLDRFDGRSTLHAWLCGIAKNKLRSARKKHRPLPLADVLEESDAEIDAILCDLDRSEVPEAALAARETRELVGAALSSLPLEYRNALIDKYVAGKSTAEIAEASGKGVKAAESMLVRARTAFAKIVALLAKKRGGLE